jgi:hypothetical protein
LARQFQVPGFAVFNHGKNHPFAVDTSYPIHRPKATPSRTTKPTHSLFAAPVSNKPFTSVPNAPTVLSLPRHSF